VFFFFFFFSYRACATKTPNELRGLGVDPGETRSRFEEASTSSRSLVARGVRFRSGPWHKIDGRAALPCTGAQRAGPPILIAVVQPEPFIHCKERQTRLRCGGIHSQKWSIHRSCAGLKPVNRDGRQLYGRRISMLHPRPTSALRCGGPWRRCTRLLLGVGGTWTKVRI